MPLAEQQENIWAIYVLCGKCTCMVLCTKVPMGEHMFNGYLWYESFTQSYKAN